LCLAFWHGAELNSGLLLSSLAIALDVWLAHAPSKRLATSKIQTFEKFI
jgi:hypothetical protein